MFDKPKQLELNEFFVRALDVMENSSKNIFITGKAGTGKSTLLQYFRTETRKDVVVLAPTGVAAVNVQGQTIHSFFRFKPDITTDKVKNIRLRKNQKNIYQNIDAIVIDEISMVRSDLLDCVDAFLRLHGKNKKAPFGGVQMVFIGDLYQLSPVVSSGERHIFKDAYASPYFFHSKVFENLPLEFVELEKIYRQKDNDFISLLNAIRNNSATDGHLQKLNQRFLPDFTPARSDFYIYLTTTNALADEINRQELAKLKAPLCSYEGEISGDFDQKSFPTQPLLEVKAGAQIMLLNNDPTGRWVNGSIGKITAIKKRKNSFDGIEVELADGRIVEVGPFTWEMFRFVYDADSQTLDSETVGSFTQYPLRLAWAVTIHKSQGKTFDKVIIDIGRGTFAHGQMYVALSRCTSFEGIVLKKPIDKKHIFMDWRVVRFMTQYQYRKSEEQCSLKDKIKILEQAIMDEKAINIIYLKANDEKTRRVISPRVVGEMEYLGKMYLGVQAYCHVRQQERVFRVDRILEIKEVKE